MPLLWLSLAFLAGILFASGVALSATTWLLFSLGSSLLQFLRPVLSLALFSNLSSLRFAARLPLAFPWLLAALFLGAARYQSVQPSLDPGFIAWYNDLGEEFILEGMLVEPADVRDTYTNLRLQVDQLRVAETAPAIPVKGLMLARILPGGEWRYGDRVEVRGLLETPAEGEDFSYRDYLAHQGIYASMPRAYGATLLRNQGNPLLKAIYTLKGRALGTVYQLYPDPEASLLAGILLGVETGIPERVQEAFKSTGTSHIIAISGFNITIIAGLFITVFSRLLGHRRGALVAVVGIAGYTVLVGADAAVVRAAIMGGFSLLARQVGRRQDGLNSLGASAALMAAFNPRVPWDVGFQLSFAATLGLVVYAEPFSQAFIKLITRPLPFAVPRLPLATAQRLAGPVGEYVLFTLAAQLTTLPITVYHFRRLSLTALLANPLILPAQPPVMIFGGLAVLLGLVSLPAGKLAAALAWPFVVFTVRVVELFDRIPGGVLVLGEVSIVMVILFYGALLGVTFGSGLSQKFLAILKPSLVVSGLGLLAVLVWRSALSAPDGRLHLTLLDVSAGGRSGDAILIQTPGGRYLLLNGGPSARNLSDGLGRRLPLLKRRFDCLVVASPAEEQIAALPRLVERYPPDEVLWAGREENSRSARYLSQQLVDAGIPITLAVPGHALDLGEGAQLRVLTSGNRGAILMLEWSKFRALLPLGSGFADLEGLQNGRQIGPVSALLLADSGYAPLNPAEWIDNLRPQVVLLSVSAGDFQGLPSLETVDAVKGYTLLRTDENGWIHLSTDGEQLWVEVERHKLGDSLLLAKENP